MAIVVLHLQAGVVDVGRGDNLSGAPAGMGPLADD